MVLVPIIRNGDKDLVVEFEVVCDEGTATLGQNCLPISSTEGAKSQESDLPFTTVRFSKGQTVQVVSVPLVHSRRFSATTFFLV
mmetsp:Transcript_73024/g.121906  ORF Transcript_73024/g.121906 Transcript_73024/m.121906 type:complete len:84 (+) Transcript_73024:50-301(+)